MKYLPSLWAINLIFSSVLVYPACVLFLFIYAFIFGCSVQWLDVGSQFPDQGLNLGHSGESEWSLPLLGNLFLTPSVLFLSFSSLLAPNFIRYSSHLFSSHDPLNRKDSRSYMERLILFLIYSPIQNSLQFNHLLFKVWGTNHKIF